MLLLVVNSTPPLRVYPVVVLSYHSDHLTGACQEKFIEWGSKDWETRCRRVSLEPKKICVISIRLAYRADCLPEEPSYLK